MAAFIPVVRQTFWELEEEIPDVFGVGRHARAYTDSEIRYGGPARAYTDSDPSILVHAMQDHNPILVHADLPEHSAELEEACVKAAVPQAAVMPDKDVRIPVAPPPGNCFAPPPGNLAPPPRPFSSSPVRGKHKPERTTVCLRNIPSRLSRAEFVKVLDDAGFSERYDFVYLPTNFRNMTFFGYAIVNFSNPADAQAALEQFSGATVEGQEVIAEWSKSQQGYDDLVWRYRDSPVMHSSVPDKLKPIILAKGRLQPFPPPTEPLQPPRKFVPTQD